MYVCVYAHRAMYVCMYVCMYVYMLKAKRTTGPAMTSLPNLVLAGQY